MRFENLWQFKAPFKFYMLHFKHLFLLMSPFFKGWSVCHVWQVNQINFTCTWFDILELVWLRFWVVTFVKLPRLPIKGLKIFLLIHRNIIELSLFISFVATKDKKEAVFFQLSVSSTHAGQENTAASQAKGTQRDPQVTKCGFHNEVTMALCEFWEGGLKYQNKPHYMRYRSKYESELDTGDVFSALGSFCH